MSRYLPSNNPVIKKFLLHFFEFVKDIYENLHFINSNFKTKDILDYLKNNPEKSNINSKYTRNKGSKSSLIKDDQYLQRSKK